MSADTIAGISVLAGGLVVSVAVFVWFRKSSSINVNPSRVAAMAAGTTLTVGALVPQAFRNSNDPDALLDGFSPFLLALFPVAILLKIMPEIAVLHDLGLAAELGTLGRNNSNLKK